PEAERDQIIEDFKAKLSEIDEAAKKARANKSDTQCNYCGRVKKFYSPLVKQNDFKLCLLCKSKFKKLTIYPGHKGSYYETEKMKLVIDQPNDLKMSVVPGHILNYR